MQFIQVNPTLTKPPRNSTAVYFLKRNEHTKTCACSEQLYSQYPKSGSNPNTPVGEWINKMYIHTME